MKTFSDLQVGDCIYEIDVDRKVVQIAQIEEIRKYSLYTVFTCNIILHDIFQGFTVFIIETDEINSYIIKRTKYHIISDENLFTEHLKQITDENF